MIHSYRREDAKEKKSTMENYWILLLGLGIFVLCIVLFWVLTRRYVQKEYGKKLWKHWPSRLSYWQAAILYSAGATFLLLFLLKWGNVLTF